MPGELGAGPDLSTALPGNNKNPLWKELHTRIWALRFLSGAQFNPLSGSNVSISWSQLPVSAEPTGASHTSPPPSAETSPQNISDFQTAAQTPFPGWKERRTSLQLHLEDAVINAQILPPRVLWLGTPVQRLLYNIQMICPCGNGKLLLWREVINSGSCCSFWFHHQSNTDMSPWQNILEWFQNDWMITGVHQEQRQNVQSLGVYMMGWLNLHFTFLGFKKSVSFCRNAIV